MLTARQCLLKAEELESRAKATLPPGDRALMDAANRWRVLARSATGRKLAIPAAGAHTVQNNEAEKNIKGDSGVKIPAPGPRGERR